MHLAIKKFNNSKNYYYYYYYKVKSSNENFCKSLFLLPRLKNKIKTIFYYNN